MPEGGSGPFGFFSGFAPPDTVDYIRKEDRDMITASRTHDREFKVWMAATLGLIKDGRMGASPARAERIKAALAFTRKGN